MTKLVLPSAEVTLPHYTRERWSCRRCAQQINHLSTAAATHSVELTADWQVESCTTWVVD